MTTPTRPAGAGAAPKLDRAQRIALLRRRVARATFPSLLLPGLGQLISGERILGGALMAGFAVGAAVAGWHLASGIALLETPLGSFVIAALLRGLAIVYLFGVADGYFTGLDPTDTDARLRRRALLLNVLWPGAGYALARLWLRALTATLVLAIIVYFASVRYQRYLDLVFIVTQLIMGVAVYQQLRIIEAREERPPRPVPPDPVALAQITALVVAVAAVIGCGYVVQLRMPTDVVSQIDADADVRIRPRSRGIEVQVAPLAMSMTASGDGWIAQKSSPGELFSARHEKNLALRLGTQLMLPFVKPERYVETLRRQMGDNGWTHQETTSHSLGGVRAYQLRFSRPLGRGQHVEQWTVAVPRDGYAVLLLVRGNRVTCNRLRPMLARTRDSIRFR